MAAISSPPPTTSQTSLRFASSHLPVTTPPVAPRFSRSHRSVSLRCRCHSQPRKNLDHVPKQFRAENLSDGLMENYQSVPECLYGLTPQQMNVFLAKINNPTSLDDNVAPESLTSAGPYEGLFDIGSLEEIAKSSHARVSMYLGGGLEDQPPDLPSDLLDARIVYLAMPLYESVTELIQQQLLYLDFIDSSKPIYFYINSTGIQDTKMELIDTESAAFSIIDFMDQCKSKVHTINMGKAFGAAALICSRGDKGNRFLLPHSMMKLQLPKTFRINGPTTDMWMHVKDLEATADIFVSILSETVGKPKEEIAKEIRHGKYFNAQEAVDYGLADRIVHSVSETSFHSALLEKQAKYAAHRSKSAREARSNRVPSGLGLG